MIPSLKIIMLLLLYVVIVLIGLIFNHIFKIEVIIMEKMQKKEGFS